MRFGPHSVGTSLFFLYFFPLRASLGIFSTHWASVLTPQLPPQSWIKGAPCRGLGAPVPVCQACSWPCLAQPWVPAEAFPLQPTQGGLFSLLGAEAKLVFPPRSGIVPQKHTMQLLKYLGLAGQPHSGPLFASQKAASWRSQVGSVPLLEVCWCGRLGVGVREGPQPFGASVALGLSKEEGDRQRTLQLSRMARSKKVLTRDFPH